VIRFLLLYFIASIAMAGQVNPFCSDCAATRTNLRDLCDYIVKNKARRTDHLRGRLLHAHTRRWLSDPGGPALLDVALAHGDALLKKQMPSGYWGTGYGSIYLADTANALGEILALQKHADPSRRANYSAALHRFVQAIERDHLIRPSGAMGTGFRAKTRWHDYQAL